MAPIPGGSGWSPDCVSMGKFVTNSDLLLCLGDVIGDRYLLQNLRPTCWAIVKAFDRSLFRVYYLNNTQRLNALIDPQAEAWPFLAHVRHLWARQVYFDVGERELWDGNNGERECYFTENVLDRLVSSMDAFPLLLRSLSQYAPHITVLDVHCNGGLDIEGFDIAFELRRFRGLKELSLRDIPSFFGEYVDAITEVLIHSPEMETLRVVSWGPLPDSDPCFDLLQFPEGCLFGLVPFICEQYSEERRKRRAKIPRLKLREVTVDQHSMNRFILDVPDPDTWPNTGSYQKPLYLEKLADL